MGAGAGTRAGELPLVGREEERASIEGVLAAARSGTGGLLLIEGPAGIGKTRLLREARRTAVAAGMTVLHGLGTEFEREYAFGVVRQALEPRVRSEDERARLLRGTARLAAPALLDVEGDVEATGFGILNGLYWLVAALAEESPVLFALDDAQWSDEPSLRFLGFLARRLDSMPVAALVGARTEADFGATPAGLGELRDHARAHGAVVEPRALDEDGIERLIASPEGRRADRAFVVACHHATGGNPFLLDELLRALDAAGVSPTEADAERVAEASVPGVTRSLNSTLDRLGADSRAIAQAVAVLGEGTPLELASALAGVDQDAAAIAADELVRGRILEVGEGLRFRHPILGGAMRDGLPAHERAAAHARAAELLRGRGAPPERVALQLLHVHPSGDGRVVEELRLAAAQARDRGAPSIAGMLLRRACAEPPPADARAELLFELGRAELDQGRLPEAEASFARAHAAADDPRLRGRAAAMMAMAIPGDPESRRRAVDLVRASQPEIASLDRELGLRLQSILVLEGEPVDDSELPGDTPAEAVVLGTLVFPRMDADARAADIADIALRSARQADALIEEGAIALAFTGAVLGLRWADRLDEAERLLTRAIAVARRRGSTTDFGMAMTLRANVYRRAGRLREAEADARSALPTAVDDRWLFARGVQPLVSSLLAQGRIDDAHAEWTAVMDGGDALPESAPMIPVILMRMALHAARREHDRALADWRDALERMERIERGVNAGWIEDLVVACDVHHALGDQESAASAANRARELADRWGTPGAIGEAMHAQARVGAVDDPLGALRSAASLLAGSPLRLEQARALVTLGGFLRRDGRRSESRDPLREGYELALACGAEGLAETARAELRSSGVRVTRPSRSGADELTPSERRIADMAAVGLSNAEIAQELFLTVKTVEMHLTHTYRKLGVRGRRELGQALTPQV